MSLAPDVAFVASPARGLIVETQHACARHPDMRGERGCTSCNNALCSACARSLAHRSCPGCREQHGKTAHVVDASWRVHLLTDALSSSWQALPRRAPALLTILMTSLLVPFAVYGLAAVDGSAGDGSTSADWTSDWGDGAALAVAFVVGAFLLGTFLQPLLVLPTVARTRTSRVVGGAFFGAFVAFAPLLLVGGVVAGLSDGGVDPEGVELVVLLGCAVAAVSLTTGLVWQGRTVLGRGPSLAGLFGAFVAHFCLAGLWSTLLTFALVPVAVVVAIGFAAGPAVAGVLGVVFGVVLWLLMLMGMGSFSAGSARYSDDLQRLR